jgi:hypothetical protein
MASIGFICNKVFCLLQTTPTLRSWFSVDIVQAEEEEDERICLQQQQPFAIDAPPPYSIKSSNDDENLSEQRSTYSEPTTPIRSSGGTLSNTSIATSWHRRRKYFEEQALLARGDSQPSLYYNSTQSTQLPSESPLIVYERLENVDDSPIKTQPTSYGNVITSR